MVLNQTAHIFALGCFLKDANNYHYILVSSIRDSFLKNIRLVNLFILPFATT